MTSTIACFICIFCYYSILQGVRIVRKQENNSSIECSIPKSKKDDTEGEYEETSNYNGAIPSRAEQIEARVMIKVISYILVFILQWYYYISVTLTLHRTIHNYV